MDHISEERLSKGSHNDLCIIVMLRLDIWKKQSLCLRRLLDTWKCSKKMPKVILFPFGLFIVEYLF